jgi:hypothetical protein
VLVRTDADGALAIGQLSHAWLSGQLARAWGNDRFPAPDPREGIALGAEQHDVGWALFDLQAGLSAETGLPRSFLELSAKEHLEIWSGAPDRLRSASAHAALVVSLHGSSLSELRLHGADQGNEELQRYVERERERQASLRAALALSEQDTDVIRRQMWTWDGLSLALCNGWEPFTARDVPALDGLVEIELRRTGTEASFTLDPWPFSVSALEVRCEARRLAGRYPDEQAMQRALQDADPLTLAFVLSA